MLNDPVNLIDPDGRFWFLPALGPLLAAAGEAAIQAGLIVGTAVGAWKVGNILASSIAGDRPEFPVLDPTGKVHGELPPADISDEDLGRYDPDDIGRFCDDLRNSVQERIRKTDQLGSDRGHAERQAAEQQLLKRLENYLGNRR